MAKVFLNRNERHDIGKIKVKIGENENPTERIKELWKRAKENHPERPVSENWSEYEKIDGNPEKK